MKVAGETWQRSRWTSPAAGSYIQPCDCEDPHHSCFHCSTLTTGTLCTWITVLSCCLWFIIIIISLSCPQWGCSWFTVLFSPGLHWIHRKEPTFLFFQAVTTRLFLGQKIDSPCWKALTSFFVATNSLKKSFLFPLAVLRSKYYLSANVLQVWHSRRNCQKHVVIFAH